MYIRKETSSNFQNEKELIRECPITYTNALLGKRWKPIILWKINEGDRTFTDLLTSIPIISRKMLFQELKHLLGDKLLDAEINGADKQYHLTELGKSLLPVLKVMWDWGEVHRYIEK
ncbi:MAG: helix-turn-helix domain-containing protein [Verrucomicrobiota bacterium]